MVNSLDLFDNFVLTISTQANEELLDLQLFVQSVIVDQTEIDNRTFPWGNSNYSSAKFYRFIFDALPEDK
jgi:hypothetical protein